MAKTRCERLQIMLTKAEIEQIEDWRFAARMPSRAAAVRELLSRGLASEMSSERPLHENCVAVSPQQTRH
jgi:hypothetical protein